MKKYIEKTLEDGSIVIKPITDFNDDEFSDNDLELLDFVIKEFGNKTAKELVCYTHRKNSPWYNTAVRNSVLEMLEKEEINNTELLIDMTELVCHDKRKKEIYKDFIESN